MDNASKALIIAGAVLIAVAVIGVSLYILNSARGFADTASEQATMQAVSSFNSFYTSYGNIVNGLDVLNIYDKVRDDQMKGYEIDISINAYAGSKNLIDALRAYTGAEFMDDKFSYTIDSTDIDGYITHVTISGAS